MTPDSTPSPSHGGGHEPSAFGFFAEKGLDGCPFSPYLKDSVSLFSS
ncbi:hypothetical protein [uncultured Bilophila sp.]|nr:hypothetical protein [uncultured Bilophila sp.]